MLIYYMCRRNQWSK